MGMVAAKKYFYLMGVFCFLLASSSLHLWADEGSRKGAPSEPQKSEDAHSPVPAQGHPKISFDSADYDAGEVWEGDVVSHTFIVKNTGTVELKIEKVSPG